MGRVEAQRTARRRLGTYCLLLLSPVLASCRTPPQPRPPGRYFTIPRAVLLWREFAAPAFGPGRVARREADKGGVRFAFLGLTDAPTGLKDDYPVAPLYGQAVPSHGNGDFSAFDGLTLRATNAGPSAVWVCLFLNTGFTGPSGRPPNALSNDTFWRGAWRRLGVGETADLFLSFDRAVPAHIADNPPPHTQGAEGRTTAVIAFDRREVTAIGLLVRAAEAGGIPRGATLLLRSVGDSGSSR